MIAQLSFDVSKTPAPASVESISEKTQAQTQTQKIHSGKEQTAPPCFMVRFVFIEYCWWKGITFSLLKWMYH
jgi:hypothetical protein